MDIQTNMDWAGEFQTMADRMAKCTSEEQMYGQLKKSKKNSTLNTVVSAEQKGVRPDFGGMRTK